MEIEQPFEINGFEYEIREAQACVGAGKGQSERMTGEQTVAVYENADRSFKYTIPAKSIASFRWGAGAEN